MVIADDFVYLHVPKTGGDAILAWCKALQEANITGTKSWIVDNRRNPEKHWSPVNRKNARGKPLYVASFRRLPDWSLSFCHLLACAPSQWSLWRIFGWDPDLFKRMPVADFQYHITLGEERVGRWLRCEHLKEDFARWMSNQLGLPVKQIKEVVDAVETKKSLKYPHDPALYWSQHEIERMYEINPVWSRIENRLYG